MGIWRQPVEMLKMGVTEDDGGTGRRLERYILMKALLFDKAYTLG